MALVKFKCTETGDLLMLESHVKAIFKAIGEYWTPQGGFFVEDLPGILETMEKVSEEDKAENMPTKTLEEELLLLEEIEDEEAREEERERIIAKREQIHLYQRMGPLKEMVRRAVKHGEPIMWVKN